MNYKVKTRTSYTLEDGDNSFDLPFEIDEYTAQVLYTADGQTAIVGALSNDLDTEDPFDTGCEGKLVCFDRRDTRPDIEEFKRIIRANPGRVFTHSGTGDCHGPGTTNCQLESNALTPKDCRGDRLTGANSVAEDMLDRSYGYYVCPEDATDPTAYAGAVLSEYSAWCNGECFGVCVWTYHKDGESWELKDDNRDECWGYIGTEYAEKTLKEEIDYTFNQLNKLAA